MRWDKVSGWHQTIIWPNAGILLIGSLGTNFNEILNIFSLSVLSFVLCATEDLLICHIYIMPCLV